MDKKICKSPVDILSYENSYLFSFSFGIGNFVFSPSEEVVE